MNTSGFLDRIGSVVGPIAKQIAGQVISGVSFTAGAMAVKKVTEKLFGEIDDPEAKKTTAIEVKS